VIRWPFMPSCNPVQRPRGRLHQISKVWLRVSTSPNEIDETGLTRLKSPSRKSAAKKFMAQPNAIGVDDIALAVLGNLANASFKIEFLYLTTADPIWFARQTHHPAKLVQCDLALGAERGQDIAQINGIFGVPIEVWTPGQSRRCYPMDHRALP
jgi:hypothetical protein